VVALATPPDATDIQLPPRSDVLTALPASRSPAPLTTVPLAVTDTTSASVGSATQIAAFGGKASPSGTLSIGASFSTTAQALPTANAGALTGGATSTGSETINATTTTTIGSNARLEANTINISASVPSISATVNSTPTASAGIGGTTATSNLTTTSTDTVTILAGANVIGHGTVNITAQQQTLSTQSLADASTQAIGTANSTANNTLTTTTTVSATDSSTTVLGNSVNVTASAPSLPTFTANADRTTLSFGSASSTAKLGLARAINWNAGIFLQPPQDPDLEFDQNGNVIAQVILTYTKDALGNITVNPLVNNSALSGTVTFSIPASFYDTNQNPPNITASAVITGTPVITFQTGFSQVTIVNASAGNLTLSAMNVINPATNFNGNVNVNVGNKSGFNFTTRPSPGHTKINIANTNTSTPTNIIFQGAINNPFGTTTVATAAGNIISGAVNGQPAPVITSSGLALTAKNGAIGANGNGNNSYFVKTIGDSTTINGGFGVDTVTLVIPDAPIDGQFTLLNPNVSNLVIDNRVYTAAVDWTNTDGLITAVSQQSVHHGRHPGGDAAGDLRRQRSQRPSRVGRGEHPEWKPGDAHQRQLRPRHERCRIVLHVCGEADQCLPERRQRFYED